MNSRGQAALEYLMTYGWALIVIAIVVGVLVFIVSSPAGIVCNSSDPAKIVVKASNIKNTFPASTTNDGTNIGTLQINNLTGGGITEATCKGSGAFEATTLDTLVAGDGCSAQLDSGASWNLKPDATATATSYSTSTITIAYKDYANLQRTTTITCSGPISVT